MVGFLKKERCKLCHTYRGNRFCLRRDKNICWHCCNGMRIDNRCPEACEYRLQKNEANTLAIGRCKVDSFEENIALNKLLIDQWMLMPSQELGDQIPIKMSETEEGRTKLQSYINRIPQNILLPLNYLLERLQLPSSSNSMPHHNYETRSEEFLQLLVMQKWEETIPYLYYAELYSEEKNIKRYIDSMTSMPVIRKMNVFSLISSAYAKDGNEGLVFYDINYKDDLTLHWKKRDGEWYLVSKIGGNPQMIYGEKGALEYIQNFLGQQKSSKAYDSLKKYSAVFMDSADMEYHWGLYYSLEADRKKAINHFQRAILLDPNFHQARFNLAFVMQADKQYDEAQSHYEILLQNNPKDTKVMNNLAIVSMTKGDLHRAKELWEKCLELEPDNENVAKNLTHFITESNKA
ncbi:MAG TPA: tetratricopeptide repeat protein [Candidatus Cloacimonadota bacterium]|nr:tetratricopeptide repeat protein [Candidatus Cloacimonadota bacterium]HPT71770.1 tetratricopeptide repeat protein [Candidatus Cloacimonadota bacterium]